MAFAKDSEPLGPNSFVVSSTLNAASSRRSGGQNNESGELAAGINRNAVNAARLSPPDRILKVDARADVVWNHTHPLTHLRPRLAPRHIDLTVLLREFGNRRVGILNNMAVACLLYTSPSPRDS